MNTRKIFRDNLFFLLSKTDESQVDIANLLHTSTSSVSSWLTGEKMPRVEKIEALADHFGVTVVDMFTPRNTRKSIPILGVVQAGLPTTASQEVLDYVDISDSMAAEGEHFGLYVHGDSMSPDFQEGDIAIVRRQPSVDDGDIAVFSIGGDDATIKEFKNGEKNIFLIPHNEEYPILMYSHKEVDLMPILILGKVVELRRSF